MPVIFHEKTKTFHLYNQEVSYLIHVMENGQLENLYYGKKIRDKEDFTYQHEEIGRSHLTVCVPEPGTLSMHYARCEYPSYGTGDYRSPAMTIRQENGSRIVDFKYASHEIMSGKPEICPLPSTYVENVEEADTLQITLYDEVMDTNLILTYSIFRDYPVITRNACIQHKGSSKIVVERAMSASVEFLDKDYEMMELCGAWARERYVKNRKLEQGIQAVQGLMGTCGGADYNPFLALKRPETTEKSGEVYGFNLVYSGNFLAQTEVSTFDMTRVMMGISPQNFSWVLGEGESFQTPEVVMVYSRHGLNGMSQAFHHLYRKNLMKGLWKDQPRPILLNNWEATYFDFDEEKLLKIAEKAKENGVELFVLDDGWFGNRTNDYKGLGDWFPNTDRLPNGISGLSEKVEALGLKFGLWFELEMVNKDSMLYREHPDWIIGTPNRFESHARHQFVLDFSRKEVVDYIYGLVSKILRESRISYIKWDMNRYMSEPFSRGLDAEHQGEVMHRYILGVYDLYRRLTSEFPHVLFESCASGGARFDAGIMQFAPQAWTSDDSDAGERMKIQYGTSLVYPIVSMGSHVSAVPNHQVHRKTPIETRANVAYFGTFGYELDLNLLSEEELCQVRKQIAFMKEHRRLLQMDGDFYRLMSPFEGNETAWMVVSKDQKQAIAAFYQTLNQVNGSWMRLKLEGLKEDTLYEVSCDLTPCEEYRERMKVLAQYGMAVETEEERVYRAYGDELMYAGIPVSREDLNKKGGDFTSLLYVIRAVEE